MEHFNLWIVGFEGLISFFSPCILPILPIYLSVLANSSVESLEDEKGRFITRQLLRNTLCFVLGISTTFFILGTSVQVMGSIFKTYQQELAIIGGLLIILMGLFYMEVIQLRWLNQEKRFHMKIREMNSISSFFLGFTFSFGWTPCIGPMLASVLIMSSTAETKGMSILLTSIYTIGFIIPFIIVALFYNKLFGHLNAMKQHMGRIKKIGGIVLVISGVLMLVSGVQGITNRPNDLNDKDSSLNEAVKEENPSEEEETDKIKAIDFELYDQYGEVHRLSDYEGKVVFLNFWATWCPPCKREMPYIEELYKEYGENSKEVVILGVAAPNLGREGSSEEIISFLEDEGYTFPVVLDTEGSLMYQYSINAFPTTFIIDKEGYLVLYVPGAMNKETMQEVIGMSQES